MKLEELIPALGNLPEQPFWSNIAFHWEESQAHFPADGKPVFLDHGEIARNFARIHYREDLVPALCAKADEILSKPGLLRFAWHIYYRVFLDPARNSWFHTFELPDSFAGENKGLVTLLIALGSVPLIDRVYAAVPGLPSDFAPNRHEWLAGTIDIYKAAHDGRPGHDTQQIGWLSYAADGILFRIGRFEFLMEENCPAFLPPVFINRKIGKIAVMARPGWTYDKDGRRVVPSSPDVFRTAEFSDAGGRIEGLHLRYDSTTDFEHLSLDRHDWEPLVSPWSRFVSMHIPAGGGMTPEVARASFAGAVEFFRKYMHRDLPVITCSSWILNEEWSLRMPESNLGKFQKSIFRFDGPRESNAAGLFFVFGRDGGLDPDDPKLRNTTLRRFMLDAMKAGRLRSNFGFIPTEFLDRFGDPASYSV